MTWFEWRDIPPGDFAVLGDPVAHSRSPQMHAAAYRSLGAAWTYNAARVPVEEFDEAVAHMAGLGYRGLNCTVPLKEAAYRWAQAMDATSRRIGAVNTLDLAMRHATNTDAPAFLAMLGAPGPALVLGAGGTARAVLVALDEAGYDVTLWNRTEAKARLLVTELGVQATVVSIPNIEAFPVVVNTTSASLHGEPLPLNWEAAQPEALAYDVVYGPSPFLDSARAAGMKTIDGLPLLVEQGALSITWWTGRLPDRSVMMEAVR